jgi:hypothetical protein
MFGPDAEPKQKLTYLSYIEISFKLTRTAGKNTKQHFLRPNVLFCRVGSIAQCVNTGTV